MQIGLFTREGRHLVGRIGKLMLSWDRHEGGKLKIAHLVDDEPVEIGTLTMALQLEEVELRADADPDPRLIPGEAGPHRLSLRAVPRLYDADGVHLGDAMQETWAWSDGTVFLNAMLRVVNPGRGGRLIGAGTEFAFAEGWQLAGGEGIRLVHESGLRVAALCHGDGSVWAHPADDPTSADTRCVWGVPEKAGPGFYRNWGPYYDQWGGAGGWASMRLEDGPVLRATWEEDELREREPTESFKGLIALVTAGDDESLARRISTFEQPLVPSVEGGRVVAQVPMEGTTMVDKTDARMKLSFPADPAGREARLHVRGVASRHVVRVSGDDPTTAFPVAYGGVADDPNGPNLLRPDDRHGPILTGAELPPDELLTTVALQPDHPVEIALESEPGLWLASQRYDERQNLLLFSTAHPGDNLGSLSLRDLKMRDLKVPGDTEPSMARLPLYWFVANSSTAHFCCNVPKSVDLIENGPENVRFRVVGQNPAGTAESDIDVTIPFLHDRLRFDLACRFTAIETWDSGANQYCNFFPEERRYPEGWGSDRVLAMAGDGQHMLIDHRAPNDSNIEDGEYFQEYEGNLFVALYGGPRGDILALSRPRKIEGATPVYQLCACWLDNHLYLSSEGDTIPAGTTWEVDLTVVLAPPMSVDEDMETLGRQALEAGEITL